MGCPDLHKSHLQTLNETGENSRKTDRPDHNELCQCIAIQGEKDIQEFNMSPMGTEWQTSEIETALVFFFGFRFGLE
jgi:hypothetical protein